MALQKDRTDWLLLFAVFVIATCGLIYELVAGTLASYLLGDSITQFSTIIGVYLFGMGLGSFLSKYLENNLLKWFIRIELLIGAIGGFSSILLFAIFPLAASFRLVLYALVLITGILVGIEVPLLMRILHEKIEFKDMVSRVFTFDYIGALLASLLFPLILVPELGLIRTSLLFGLLNLAVAIYLIEKFKATILNLNGLKVLSILLLTAEVIAFAFAPKIQNWTEELSYNENLIYSSSSPYQRIVLTHTKNTIKLYLNNNLQFASSDEYRYHEALVHPAILAGNEPKNILILGGGDGLAAREILKYAFVKKITLVDLDSKITDLFAKQEILTKLNQHSLSNPKVKVINADAWVWLKSNQEEFDCIIVDFPDPTNYSIGKLYSTLFYELLWTKLSPFGIGVVQSTSPYAAPKSYWCVNKTIQTVGFKTLPYHNYVPSFGEWGYILFSKKQLSVPKGFSKDFNFLSDEQMKQMVHFPNDMLAHEELKVNRLNNQILIQYFDEEWGRFN